MGWRGGLGAAVPPSAGRRGVPTARSRRRNGHGARVLRRMDAHPPVGDGTRNGGRLKPGDRRLHACGDSLPFRPLKAFCPFSPRQAAAGVVHRHERTSRGWGRLRLSTQILLLQFAIIVLTLGTGVAVSSCRPGRNSTSRRAGVAGDRAHGLADPVLEAFAARIPSGSSTRSPSGSASHRRRVRRRREQQGIRYSHPDREKIGQRVSTDPSEALQAGSTSACRPARSDARSGRRCRSGMKTVG